MRFEKEIKIIKFFILVWLVVNISLLPLAAAYSDDEEVFVVRKSSIYSNNGSFGKVIPLENKGERLAGKLSPALMAAWWLAVVLLAGFSYFGHNKRSQFNTTLIVVLAVLTAGVIIVFGYNIIKSNIKRQCTANLEVFQEDIKAAINEKMHKIGSVEEYEYGGLCGINQIYFIDKDEEINVTDLSETPEIMDSANSSSEDNIFLMAGSELKRAFYIGNIRIPNPNYLCFVVNNGALKMLLEGKGVSTRLKHRENMFNCGPTIIEPTVQEAEEILNDTTLFLETALGVNESEALMMFSETENDMELSREINCSGNTAVVEIEIAPKEGKGLKKFKYVEKIPKECIDNITGKINSSGFIEGTDFFVKGDPLIVWKFDDEIDEEQGITYNITDECDSMVDCAAILEGLGLAEDTEVVSNLKKNKVKLFPSNHNGNGVDVWINISKSDNDTVIVYTSNLLHIETRKDLEEEDKIIIYANCNSSGTIYLSEEEQDNRITNTPCSTMPQRLELTIPDDYKSKRWDLDSDVIVYYDFITSRRDDD